MRILILLFLTGCVSTDKAEWQAAIDKEADEIICAVGVPPHQHAACAEAISTVAECVLDSELTDVCIFEPNSHIPPDIQLDQCVEQLGIVEELTTRCINKLQKEK